MASNVAEGFGVTKEQFHLNSISRHPTLSVSAVHHIKGHHIYTLTEMEKKAQQIGGMINNSTREKQDEKF